MLAVTSRPPFENWILRPVPPRHSLLYERSALLISATEECNWGAPARSCTSSFRLRRAACRTVTLRELKVVRHAGAAPALCLWKRRVLAVTPMARMKVVAAFGIAPNSPRLQRGANLSQLRSQMVPPRGIAPRSLAYRARALLLSYGGMNWSRDVVTLRGLPGVGRMDLA
jgi:hypothetical protein